MKNLRKLTNKELKTIAGGAERCPVPATWCTEWCTWSAWQKARCLNAVVDVMPCDC